MLAARREGETEGFRKTQRLYLQRIHRDWVRSRNRACGSRKGRGREGRRDREGFRKAQRLYPRRIHRDWVGSNRPPPSLSPNLDCPKDLRCQDGQTFRSLPGRLRLGLYALSCVAEPPIRSFAFPRHLLMKQWTSEPQRHWLENRIPEFRRALRLKRVKAFLDDTSHKFLIEFPAAKPDKEPSTPVSQPPTYSFWHPLTCP